jgi:hypothetical protein
LFAFAVVVYDYTGYGCSEGGLRPSESRACNDIRAVYQHVVSSLGVKPANVVLYGRSMGTVFHTARACANCVSTCDVLASLLSSEVSVCCVCVRGVLCVHVCVCGV